MKGKLPKIDIINQLKLLWDAPSEELYEQRREEHLKMTEHLLVKTGNKKEIWHELAWLSSNLDILLLQEFPNNLLQSAGIFCFTGVRFRGIIWGRF